MQDPGAMTVTSNSAEAFQWGALAITVLITVVLAGLGGVIAGGDLRNLYKGMKTPRWQIPLWGSLLVGGLGYVMDVFIFYRLLVDVRDPGGRTVAVAALLVVMVYNELWNATLFRLRSALAAFVGLLGFIAPLAILQVALWVYDPMSAWVLLIYWVWLLAYDIPWMYTLWRLNSP